MFRFNRGHDFHPRSGVFLLIFLFGLLLWLAPRHAPAAVLGMLADHQGNRISVFDAETGAVSRDFAATPGQALGDCAISSDQNVGITTNSSNLLSFVNLAEPSIAGASAGPGQLTISNLGVDMSLSPNDRFLVSAGGGALAQPLSVVDIGSQSEVAVASPFVDHTSVEFCDDGTLLVTTNHGQHYGPRPDNALYDAFLDEFGEIHLLGGRLSSGAQPNNSVCAPGSRIGVLLDREGGITSFMVATLEPAGSASAAGKTPVAAVFSGDGRKLYVRTSNTVEAFDVDPESGALGPDWVRQAPFSATFFGMDQIAMHPLGDKLYVDGGDVLLILNPDDGSQFGSIAAGDATGVCFAKL